MIMIIVQRLHNTFKAYVLEDYYCNFGCNKFQNNSKSLSYMFHRYVANDSHGNNNVKLSFLT